MTSILLIFIYFITEKTVLHMMTTSFGDVRTPLWQTIVFGTMECLWGGS